MNLRKSDFIEKLFQQETIDINRKYLKLLHRIVIPIAYFLQHSETIKNSLKINIIRFKRCQALTRIMTSCMKIIMRQMEISTQMEFIKVRK